MDIVFFQQIKARATPAIMKRLASTKKVKLPFPSVDKVSFKIMKELPHATVTISSKILPSVDLR